MSKGLMSQFKALSKLTYRANMDNDTTVEQCLEWYNIVATALKALEIIKETRGDSILSDIKNGSIFGCPYTKLPNKEKIDLLKEVLL